MVFFRESRFKATKEKEVQSLPEVLCRWETFVASDIVPVILRDAHR